ncbi:MAG: DUF370 domain-containing protein [Clostridia bacterium]|nr:DUF370 domain-containing protein [Clostridia bacterium]
MMIHIGGGRVVRSGSILGVFDMDGHADSAVNRAFLKNAEKQGRTATAGDDLPRSFVVTDTEVIFTHISTSAIVGRSG